MSTVLLIGDSIAAWAGGYADQSTHTIVNSAVAGDTTQFWATKANFNTRAQADFRSNRIEVVHIQLGTNDASQLLNNTDGFLTDMKAVVAHVQSYGDFDILIGIPPRFPHLSNASQINLRLEGYKVGLRNYINSNPDVRLGLDWPEYSDERPGQDEWVFVGPNWDDFAHPSTAGHTIVTPFFDIAVTGLAGTVTTPTVQKKLSLNGQEYTFSNLNYEGNTLSYKVGGDAATATLLLPASGGPTVTLGTADRDHDKTVTLAAGAASSEVTVVTVQG